MMNIIDENGKSHDICINNNEDTDFVNLLSAESHDDLSWLNDASTKSYDFGTADKIYVGDAVNLKTKTDGFFAVNGGYYDCVDSGESYQEQVKQLEEENEELRNVIDQLMLSYEG